MLFASWVWIDPSCFVTKYAGNTISFSELYSGFKFFSWSFWALAYQWAAMHLVDILRYVLPDFLDPFVIYALIEKAYVAPIIVDVLIAINFVRDFFGKRPYGLVKDPTGENLSKGAPASYARTAFA